MDDADAVVVIRVADGRTSWRRGTRWRRACRYGRGCDEAWSDGTPPTGSVPPERRGAAVAKARVLAEGLYFGEGPRWHDGRLCFSDFYDHAVKRFDLDGNVETVVEVPAQPSGLGWLPDGRMLIVSMLDRKLLRLEARRHARRARRPVRDRHLPRQRHGRRRPGPGLRRQLRLRPRRVHARARRRGCAGRTRATDGQAGPRRPRRHGERGGRRPQVPQRHGHHARRPHDDPRRDVAPAAHRVRHRLRRHAAQPAGVGRPRRPAARRHLPSTPTATCGWPTRSSRCASWSPRAGASSTRSRPISRASPACSADRTAATCSCSPPRTRRTRNRGGVERTGQLLVTEVEHARRRLAVGRSAWALRHRWPSSSTWCPARGAWRCPARRRTRRTYAPASLADEGFVHCTAGDDLLLQVANSFYADVEPDDFLVLSLDEDRLGSRGALGGAVPAPPPGSDGHRCSRTSTARIDLAAVVEVRAARTRRDRRLRRLRPYDAERPEPAAPAPPASGRPTRTGPGRRRGGRRARPCGARAGGARRTGRARSAPAPGRAGGRRPRRGSSSGSARPRRRTR